MSKQEGECNWKEGTEARGALCQPPPKPRESPLPIWKLTGRRNGEASYR